MPRILSKKEKKADTNLQLKFVIDCSQPVEDKVLMLSDFEKFLKERIKIDGRTGNFGENVVVSAEQSSIVLTSKRQFSKRYLKYLTKKYLKKQTLRNYLYVTASDKNTYQLRYFNIQQGNAEEE